MFGKISFLVCLVAIALTSNAARAGDDAGNYYVRGFGSQSCERFLRERKAGSPAYLVFRAWANGYITTYSQFAAKTYDAAADFDIGVISALLANYCRKQKKHNFATAAYAVTRELQKYRIEKRSPVVVIPAGKKKIRVFEATLRRVQASLKRRGLYTGRTDGKFGKGTSAAITAYQKKKKLKPTGIPDGPTLLAIYKDG